MRLISQQTFSFPSYLHVKSRLFHNSSAILARLQKKLSYGSCDAYDVNGRVKAKQQYIFAMDASRFPLFLGFLKKFIALNLVHENQLGEVLSYEYEPEVRENTGNTADKSDRLWSDVPGNVCNSSVYRQLGSYTFSIITLLLVWWVFVVWTPWNFMFQQINNALNF